MTALMTSNVLSIGPLEEGGAADDGGLKAGVAPGNMKTKTNQCYETLGGADEVKLHLNNKHGAVFTVFLHLLDQSLRCIVQEEVWKQGVTCRPIRDHSKYHMTVVGMLG